MEVCVRSLEPEPDQEQGPNQEQGPDLEHRPGRTRAQQDIKIVALNVQRVEAEVGFAAGLGGGPAADTLLEDANVQCADKKVQESASEEEVTLCTSLLAEKCKREKII